MRWTLSTYGKLRSSCTSDVPVSDADLHIFVGAICHGSWQIAFYKQQHSWWEKHVSIDRLTLLTFGRSVHPYRPRIQLRSGARRCGCLYRSKRCQRFGAGHALRRRVGKSEAYRAWHHCTKRRGFIDEAVGLLKLYEEVLTSPNEV